MPYGGIAAVAVVLPGGNPEVPVPPLLAAGRDAAHRLGVQHGGAPTAAAEGRHRGGVEQRAEEKKQSPGVLATVAAGFSAVTRKHLSAGLSDLLTGSGVS